MSGIDSPILGGKALATQAQALAYLRHQNPAMSPNEAQEITRAYWERGTFYDIAPDLAFSQACHETNLFRFGGQVAASQHNPAGLGATNDGAAGLGWQSWEDGVGAHFLHLLAWCNDQRGRPDRRWSQVMAAAQGIGFATTWRSLGGRWAVPGVGYGDGIERHWQAITQEQGAMKRIAIAAGHHNSDGGDQYEYQQTGKLAAAVAESCRALGMDVVLLTPDNGAGMFLGGIWEVAAAAVALQPPPDIFLECHTEGGGSTGVFAIYPDAAGDLDTDVRDLLGPDVAQRVAAATGLGLGGPQRNGIMSEKQTGVGGQGFRLGIFNKTQPIKADCTRLIIEYGAHDKQPDLGISQRPDFYAQCGRATAASFAVFLGLPTAVTAQEAVTKPPPVSDPGFPGIVQADQSLVINGQTVPDGRAIRAERLLLQVLNDQGKQYFVEWVGHQWQPWQEGGIPL